VCFIFAANKHQDKEHVRKVEPLSSAPFHHTKTIDAQAGLKLTSSFKAFAAV
jgi:hypothetical protein